MGVEVDLAVGVGEMLRVFSSGDWCADLLRSGRFGDFSD